MPVIEAHLFQTKIDVKNINDITKYYPSRHEGKYLSFWFKHECGSQLAVMLNGSIGVIHFFPNAKHPVYQAIGQLIDPDKSITFLADNYELTPLFGESIVSQEAIEIAIKDYLHDGSRSKFLEWNEL